MRLIDADALITFWTECLTQEEIDTWDMRIATVIENVKDQPTIDAVPVVRCKDCVDFNKDQIDGVSGYCGYDAGNHRLTNWFCCFGKRREVTE